jgi:hypothetical protein
MKKTINSIVLSLALGLCLFAGASAAGASPLQMSLVPADALWVIHLDMERFTSTAMFKMLMDEEGAARMQRRADDALQKFHIDPQKDLKGITLYGRGKGDEDAVVAVSGTFDKAHLLGLLKQDTEHTESMYGKHTILGWDGDHFGAFATDNLILLSEKQVNLQAALDVLDGKIKAASGSSAIARIMKESPNSIMAAAATDISGMLGKREKPVMLSKMKTAALSVAEVGDITNLKVSVGAESAQVAKELEQAIRGLIAIANLQLTDADAQLLTKSINIGVDGENVRIDAAYPTVKLVELLKKRGALPHIRLDQFSPLSYY